ncbi:MAG: hypothetical protein DI527_00820 [Chelatococcus sp.]|nr:MAG: hypothetical protein DI527_00820 [Chelatococcus sp.]
MALIGVHIAFGYALDTARDNGGAFLRADTVNSQTIAAPGVSTISAPQNRGKDSPVLSVVSADAIFYAIGPNPDASAGSAARDYLKANDPIDRYVKPGDKFAWIAA